MKQKYYEMALCLVACFCTMFFAGACGGPSVSSISEIQKLLDNNPEIKRVGIYLKVIKFENGYLTIDVIDVGKKMANWIREGTPLDNLVTLYGSTQAKVLKDVKETLQKRPEVNGVLFTASCYEAHQEYELKKAFLKKASAKQIEQFWLELASKYPNFSLPYSALGIYAIKNKTFDLAEKYCKKGLEIKPNNPLLINELCWDYYLQNRNLTWAKEKMAEIVDLFPNWPYGLGTYGAILLKTGDSANAIIYLQRAINLHKRKKDIAADSYFLSMAYAKSGNIHAAQKALKKAIKLDPNYEFRKEAEKVVIITK